MGYTHRIIYMKFVEFFGDYIEHGFPTTSDMVERHIAALSRSKLVKNVRAITL